MKKIVFLATLSILAIAYGAAAQVTCTQYANGQVICVPAGGGNSSYR